MAGALAIAAFAVSLAPPGSIGSPALLAVLGLAAVAWVLRPPANVHRDDVLPAAAVALSGIGLAVIARLSDDLAHKQVLWLAVSLIGVHLIAPSVGRFRRLATFKYLWVLASIALFGLLAVIGEEVNGARLWIRLGPIHYEPVELIKLFIVFFLAGYLAETADIIAAARPWSVRANAKYLGPLFLGWGASMAILVFERDIGMATLLLLTFAIVLYVATQRIDLIAGGTALFALAVMWATRHYTYIGTRIDAWRAPFDDPLGRGYQPLQGLFSIAAGGLFGTGYGLGHPTLIPEASTDYVFATWSEEFGALGALVLIAVFSLIVYRILRIAERQSDRYAKLLATGLAATFGVQVLVIVGGVLGLFPLTGITLPFISYGGSSLVANFVLITLAWGISSRRESPSAQLVPEQPGDVRMQRRIDAGEPGAADPRPR